MKNIRKEAGTDIIDTEKTANSIMFVAWTVIAVMALVFVIFFLMKHGRTGLHLL